jgi:hypothetical protein
MIRMDELDKIEHLLHTKNFVELTAEEKFWIRQWIDSEAEYENLRKSEARIKQHFIDANEFISKPNGLEELKANLRKQTSQSLNWWQVKVPAWSTLLVAGCFAFGAWWFTSSSVKPIVDQQIVSSVVYDTVYVASKPDTVYVQHVVYKERPVLLTKTVNQVSTKSATNSNGINMKEKEELENLLVSGSM